MLVKNRIIFADYACQKTPKSCIIWKDNFFACVDLIAKFKKLYAFTHAKKWLMIFIRKFASECLTLFSITQKWPKKPFCLPKAPSDPTEFSAVKTRPDSAQFQPRPISDQKVCLNCPLTASESAQISILSPYPCPPYPPDSLTALKALFSASRFSALQPEHTIMLLTGPATDRWWTTHKFFRSFSSRQLLKYF